MTKRIWIKLYIEMLDSPKMGRLPDDLWRLAVELFLLAGSRGNDGVLPPVEEMAWSLRMQPERLQEQLHALADAGVLNLPATGAWMLPHFAKWQSPVPVEERVRQFRERQAQEKSREPSRSVTDRYKKSNEGAGVASTSTSTSDSISDSDSEEQPPAELPTTPAEAMAHPDVQVFAAVTGGRIPGLAQYQTVIETVRLLRRRRKLDEAALREYLSPFWLAWRSRKRLDGRPYDPGNLTWLAEWALNGSIPPPGGSQAGEAWHAPLPTPQETRRMLAEREQQLKSAVPPPQEVLASMQRFKQKLEKQGRK